MKIRQHPDIIEVYYRDKLTETMPRIRGEQPYRIHYRHVIWSLVRKPGAFARYRYRERTCSRRSCTERAYDAFVKDSR